MNDSALEAAIAPLAAAHPGCSGIHPLPGGLDAFAARMLLAGAAERTLDVQYYIWDGDKTGTLLFNALRAAADRGVRVRLLLDDHNAIGLDETLAELDTHPMLEVRLFNPLRIRRPRWINYLIDFTRVNRRMHNKSITADAAATIVGGRNVADKYFDASDEIVFADLDVLAVGPVARDVAADFERYWNSVSACPARRLLPRQAPAADVVPARCDRRRVGIELRPGVGLLRADCARCARAHAARAARRRDPHPDQLADRKSVV